MKQIVIGLVLGCCVVMLTVLTLVGGAGAIAAPIPKIDDIGLCAVPEGGIDLNNANLMAFTDCPGFYPGLASAILTHGPYQAVDDVLSIPDLTDTQKVLLEANLQSFAVTAPAVPIEKRMPPRINQSAH
ncbi:photosystem II complex extrinsic protein PsbU [Leptolyngbya sp. KIOST-1]|uniref:photosystem II complex extrinsic protein PsbU n=1 Tax=Leptolyngbya sp. KIOST-1 TaxID=1229172 RepID=UPI000907BBFE|nr:photosystem II complex extrinsic protein PsbU [Leptolyngbya sp. KIOST-1]